MKQRNFAKLAEPCARNIYLPTFTACSGVNTYLCGCFCILVRVFCFLGGRIHSIYIHTGFNWVRCVLVSVSACKLREPGNLRKMNQQPSQSTVSPWEIIISHASCWFLFYIYFWKNHMKGPGAKGNSMAHGDMEGTGKVRTGCKGTNRAQFAAEICRSGSIHNGHQHSEVWKAT